MNYLKGFLCSFCCPNATLPEGSVHAGPVSVWLRLGGDRSGMELSHRGGSGWAEPNGDRRIWAPRAPLLHIWPHLVAPRCAAPPGGHGVSVAGTNGLCALRWRCCCWGQLPVPAVTLQAGGGCGVTSALAMAASSSSLLPHLPLGWWLNGRSKGDGCTRFRICFLTDDFSCSSLEGGLQ